jgi:ubiquitin fusion degradation protein 1
MLDFRASERRLKERTSAAAVKAKAKADREREALERQRAREVAREEEQRRRRLQIEREREEAQREAELELEMNQGVVWRGRLQAVPSSESVAAVKGIKRAADKLLLPPSAGRHLLSQDAQKNGAPFFEVRHPVLGCRTHAGVLEYTAAEGFVALPRKVVRCIWGPDAEDDRDVGGYLDVRYCRLPKGTRAVFQPRLATFQQAIGDDVESALESALLQHSALTVGDWIEVVVPSTGECFDVRVKELEPAVAVSVIDTELEAEVLPSVETEERLIAEELEARKAMEAAAKLEEEREREEAAKVEAETAELQRRRSLQEAKAASLPNEPEAADENTVYCLFRFPDGGRWTRRFRAAEPVSLLFDFADSKGAGGNEPGEYRLVTQYPRNVFEVITDGEKSLESAGLKRGQRHVIFVEASAPP